MTRPHERHSWQRGGAGARRISLLGMLSHQFEAASKHLVARHVSECGLFLMARVTEAENRAGRRSSSLQSSQFPCMNTLSEFAKRIRSPESMAIFNQMVPTITRAAGATVDGAKRRFSDDRYHAPNELEVQWIPQNKFQAEASYRDEAGTQHRISICDGVSKLLYMDAFLLPELCERHLAEAQYEELFALCDYGNGRRRIIPEGMTKNDFKIGVFTHGITWVYLHEQAHLFQRHSEVFARRTGKALAEQRWTWQEAWKSSERGSDDREETALKHLFELSADHEATSLVMQGLLYQDMGSLRRSSLWLFGLALTCIFKRFYGQQRAAQTARAQGSHPSAAVRMRFAVEQLIADLTHPLVKQYVPWGSASEIHLVLMHAFNVGNIYMELAHGNAEFPEFMSRFSDQSEESKAYLANLAILWNGVHPELVQHHFGHGPGCILPPFAASQDATGLHGPTHRSESPRVQ